MADPFVAAYPQRQRALERKYDRLGPALSGAPGPMAAALLRMDTERAERGVNPLSDAQTGRVLSTALTGQAATPAKDPSFIESFANDIRSVANPMNLVRGLAHEVAAIPQAGEQIRESLANARNPWEAVGGIAAAPGVRFAPGTFILENALSGWNAETDTRGSFDVLKQHPGFVAMDVTPYAGKAAKATKVGKAAEAAGRRALPAVFTKTLDDGALVPNALGRRTEAAATRFNASAPGMAVGNQARNLASLVARRSEQTMTNPERFDPVMGALEREAITLAQEGDKAIPNPLRRREIYNGFTQDRSLIELIPDATERDWAFRMADLTDRVQAAKVERGQLVDIDGEWYLPQRVRGLQRSQTRADVADLFVSAQRNLTDIDVDPTMLWDEAADLLDRADAIKRTGKGRDLQNLNDQGVRQILGGYLAKIEQASPHDYTQIRRAMRAGDDKLGLPKLTGKTVQPWVRFLRDHDFTDPQGIQVFRDGAITAGPRPGAVLDVVDMLRSKPHLNARQAELSGRLDQAWKSGDHNAVIQILQKVYPQARFNTAGERATLRVALREARNAREVTRGAAAINRVKVGNRTVNAKTAATHRATFDKLKSSAVPDRFGNIVETELRGKARDYVQATYANDPRLPQMIEEVARSHYANIPEEAFHALRRDAMRTWQGHKAAGADPIFVHRVTQGGANRLASPLVLDRAISPSSWHERTFSDPPAIKDLAVSMRHDTWEHVARQASLDLVDEIGASFGKSFDDVALMYRKAAEKRWRRHGTGTLEEHLRHYVNRDWVQFNPAEFVPWGKATRTAGTDTIMVPKGVAGNLRKMAEPMHEHLSSVINTPMKVFRTSVLALSPRWHVYNVLGGYMMTALRTDPAILRYFGEANRLRKSGDAPDDLILGSGAGSAPSEFARDWTSSYARDMKRAIDGDPKDPLVIRAKQRLAEQGMDYAGGRTMRRLLDEAAAKGGDAVNWSYKMNGVVDDMYRAMSYLYGRDKAYRKAARVGGDLSDEAAQAAGIALVNKIMPDWAKMTPMERTAVKSVVPFYGFARHIVEYAATMPADHPWRVAVLANIAETELQDWNSGWPQAWQQLFFFGKPDEFGRQRAVDPSGFNPFADVANYARLLGFVTGDPDGASLGAITGQMGPILQYGMRMAGIDPQTGSAELYSDMGYDPQTGRLISKAEFGNPLYEAANMFAPQVGFVMGAVTDANDWREMSRDDPASAGRQMFTRFGIPLIPKQVDRYDEMFKAEIKRGEAQDDARREAQTSGDWSILNAYEGLDAYRQQIETLEQTGQLDQFRPARKPLPSMNQLFSASFSVG